MRELRFFCRGFNRALLHLGFKISETDLTPKESLIDMNGGMGAVFNQMIVGKYTASAGTGNGGEHEGENAMEDIIEDNAVA